MGVGRVTTDQGPASLYLRETCILPVTDSNFGLMSAVLRCVSKDGMAFGGVFELPLEKAPAILERIDSRVPLLLSANDQHGRRLAGAAVGRALVGPKVYDRDGSRVLPTAILTNQPVKGETGLKRVDPRGARHTPLVWMGKYQLVERSSLALTWRLSDAEFERLTERVLVALRSQNLQRVHGVLDGLLMHALFSGVTHDVRRLIKLAGSSWAHRTRRSAGPATDRRLNVQPYLARARPRRGVGVPVYRRHPDGSLVTLEDLLEEEGVMAM